MGDEEARGSESGPTLRFPLQMTGIVLTLILTGKRSGGTDLESEEPKTYLVFDIFKC